MTTEIYTYASVSNGLVFDQQHDLLGSGTVGEVFRAEIRTGNRSQVFALKRFLNRPQRDDFDNEKAVLDALASTRHRHITYYLFAWTALNAQYLLFPLATGDLKTFLNKTPPPESLRAVENCIFEQMLGVCDAIKYTHEHIVIAADGQRAKRLGFHHDLKPANILLFENVSEPLGTWKLCDFGSGTVDFFDTEATAEIYNRKASTGDKVYSAPEYLVEGRVSRSKDIWSLGCIFLEVFVWAQSHEIGEVMRFREARSISNPGSSNSAVYWAIDAQKKPYINPAVARVLQYLQRPCSGAEVSLSILQVIGNMLCVEASHRPTAEDVCKSLQSLKGN
ncbi:uncharacterized protein FPRO_12709 [Fusarium proliferatum ET1]|uniref:Protein kinase domain-containing protein n=1 Tax=Fusarium proliferatum (strain ET1) TaxID=1227346 RepID=A0A1L7W663_FUSPR|nr:uncharacterized protein FPRO_12709 [Fusarium proliferatum ET1]CZR48099.1 uncharacterized protein FPRO_12709 [Fusarium proliferatum ET1]